MILDRKELEEWKRLADEAPANRFVECGAVPKLIEAVKLLSNGLEEIVARDVQFNFAHPGGIAKQTLERVWGEDK